MLLPPSVLKQREKTYGSKPTMTSLTPAKPPLFQRSPPRISFRQRLKYFEIKTTHPQVVTPRLSLAARSRGSDFRALPLRSAVPTAKYGFSFASAKGRRFLRAITASERLVGAARLAGIVDLTVGRDFSRRNYFGDG